jgi:TolB protein
MKRTLSLLNLLTLLVGTAALAQEVLPPVEGNYAPGNTPPTWVSMSGITGDAATALRFDLYVQGFAFTNAEAAQYLISGSNNGNLQAKATDPHNKSTLVSKAYSGASLQRQAHAFADDFVQALGRKGIAQTKIAFKGENSPNSEIYVADFDGHNAQSVTKDNNLVAAPCWVPGHMALYYVSYKLNHADIFYHDLSTGARRAFARYGGSNMSPSASSPNGSKVAMILSKDGWTDLYVCDADGTNLKRLTTSPQDESSPCWSPDGKWICYAAKDKERRTLCKISPSGGTARTIGTSGFPSPSEPDWSPDGKWIAFTAQYRSGFQICVVPADGGTATSLVEGEDPSWAPNSRTLAFGRRSSGRYVLSLLDVPTKQYKDVSRIPGISSQSQPSWAK